jgi:hypothetical protein
VPSPQFKPQHSQKKKKTKQKNRKRKKEKETKRLSSLQTLAKNVVMGWGYDSSSTAHT